MLRKKWIRMFLLVGIVFLGFTATIYGTSTSPNLTRQEIESPNTTANRRSIAEKVLRDTGRTGQFTPEEATNVFVYYINLLGSDRAEVVIQIEFGPKNSIVAVYTPEGNGYDFVSDIGEFFYIRNITAIPLPDDNDILILREYANQDIGAFERSSFLRGYQWDGTDFQEVLKVPEGIESTWNELWDGETTNGESKWNRIEQRTDIAFEDGSIPTLSLTSYQAHRVSEPSASMDVPNETAFSTVNNRIVTETYTWSPQWHRFILSEMTDNQTGEPVAVIEDLGSSPYALLDDYGNNANKVRIVKQDGSTDIVDKSTLTPVNEEQATNVFLPY